jgi:integrase
VKIRPVLRDVLAELRARSNPAPNALVFGTAAGKPQNPSNVRARVVAKAVKRANKRLQEAGEAPLPGLTPHGLRRSFASLLYGIGEAPTVVMQGMGHTDPALALAIYAHAMRRDEGENERLRALVEGVEMPALVTSDHSEDPTVQVATNHLNGASRSTSGV